MFLQKTIRKPTLPQPGLTFFSYSGTPVVIFNNTVKHQMCTGETCDLSIGENLSRPSICLFYQRQKNKFMKDGIIAVFPGVRNEQNQGSL
jgi:hypothetical protein